MTASPIVDPHHHLWDLTHNRYPWLQDAPFHDRGWGDWSSLRSDYLIDDFLADAHGQHLIKSVHVQANYDPPDPVGETRWLQGIADRHGFPHGIVAYANLAMDDVARTLEAHAQFKNLRGIRQVLNRHADPALNRADRDYLADERWRRNFALLRRHDLSFDVQVYYRQMTQVAELARHYPDIQLILDHDGMPAERDAAALEGWRQGMAVLAQCPNIAVKLCGYGMVDLHWTVDSIRPFIERTLDLFGTERCMFASNFPVDKLMGSYARTWDAYRDVVASYSPDERGKLFCDNAIRIYRL
jgi:predicted TIM-barrel fold metal-dependent hydrolase